MRLTVVAALALAFALGMGTDARAGDSARVQTENVYINVTGLG